MRFLRLLIVIFLLGTLLSFCYTASAQGISLMSENTLDWTSVDAVLFGEVSNAALWISNSVWKFGNTAGLWPGMKHILGDEIIFNINTDRIAYDFTPFVQTSFHIFFKSSTGESQTVVINPVVHGATIDPATGDIQSSSIPLKGELSLRGLTTGMYNGKSYEGKDISEFSNTKGDIYITGICIFIIGTSEKTVDVRALSVVDPVITNTRSTTTTRIKLSTSTASKTVTQRGNKTTRNTTKKAVRITTTSQSKATGDISYNISSGFIKDEPKTVPQGDHPPNAVSSDTSRASRIINSHSNESKNRDRKRAVLVLGCPILVTACFLFIRRKPEQKNGN